MNRSRYDGGPWFLWYAIPGTVLASLLSLQALDAVEYAEYTLGAMAIAGATILLLVAAVHYAAVYRG